MLGIPSRPLGLIVALAMVGSVVAPAALAAPQGGGKGQAAKKAQSGVKAAHASSWNFTPVPGVAAERPQTEAHKGLDARVGSLPFTGWDLIILGGVSMVLSGMGVMLRRLSMPRAPRL
jgi:hypothetical protein